MVAGFATNTIPQITAMAVLTFTWLSITSARLAIASTGGATAHGARSRPQ